MFLLGLLLMLVYVQLCNICLSYRRLAYSTKNTYTYQNMAHAHHITTYAYTYTNKNHDVLLIHNN